VKENFRGKERVVFRERAVVEDEEEFCPIVKSLDRVRYAAERKLEMT